MELRTRPKWVVLNDLNAKLRALSSKHPDRPQIARMIRDLGREIESKPRTQRELRLLPQTGKGSLQPADAPG
jgi:hypothetical protein